MAKEHLEAFQHGNRMGILTGYRLALSDLRDRAMSVLAEGRAEAARATQDAWTHLSERLGELDKIHERIAADGRIADRLTAEMVARRMDPNEAGQKARRTVEEVRKLEALDREADEPKPAPKHQYQPATPRGCSDGD